MAINSVQHRYLCNKSCSFGGGALLQGLGVIHLNVGQKSLKIGGDDLNMTIADYRDVKQHQHRREFYFIIIN